MAAHKKTTRQILLFIFLDVICVGADLPEKLLCADLKCRGNYKFLIWIDDRLDGIFLCFKIDM